MSPGINVVVKLPGTDRRPPRNRVLEAVLLARAEGVPLAFSPDYGVGPAQFTGGWVVERGGGRIPGVNVIGAMLLQWQPTVRGDEDPSATLAWELGVSLGYVEGIADGWQALPSTYWLTREGEGKHYRNGLEVGYELRLYASLCCNSCGSRRMKGDGPCPGCDR